MGGNKISELIVNVVLVITGIGLFISAQAIETGTTMGKGSDFMPKLCTAIWVVLAVILLLQSIKMKDDSNNFLKISKKGLLMTLAYLLGYILLLNLVGFIISSILYLFVQMMLFVPDDYRTKNNCILFAALSTVIPFVVQVLFVNVFSLLLPTGIIF